MRHGFIKTAAVTPLVKVADCSNNADKMISIIEKASEEGVHLLVFPELCLTSATCGDLFFQTALMDEAKQEAARIVENVPSNMVVVFGLPFEYSGSLYNCALVASDSKVLGIVPQQKPVLSKARWFSPAPKDDVSIEFADSVFKFGKNQIFTCSSLGSFRFACELGTDYDLACSPDSWLCSASATVIVHLDSKEGLPGKSDKLLSSLKERSSKLKCAFVHADAGEGESTTDLVFTADNAIVENGEVLLASSFETDSVLISEIDVLALENGRRTGGAFCDTCCSSVCFTGFDIEMGDTQLTRHFSKSPFIPEDETEREQYCSEVIRLQALGLKHRILHTHSKTAVIGLSGGLDSTLALLVAVTAFDMMAKSRENIVCITLPCFGTTEKTKSNAVVLAQCLGCTIKTVDIGLSVSRHFEDIGHSDNIYDTTFENAQARERTQVLMDIANMNNGLVIGTGDLSELALGWATYNGDHMSMYGVNAGVPKTLVRSLVKNYADNSDNEVLINTLYSILDTPISPELIPGGSQATEDLVGPYELHDFFIWHMLVHSSSPSKILRLAKYVFEDEYSEETILKWLKTFTRRFFAQQFKRSCLPDGPKVGPISLSPRGSWSMPSDAFADAWQRELDNSLI